MPVFSYVWSELLPIVNGWIYLATLSLNICLQPALTTVLFCWVWVGRDKPSSFLFKFTVFGPSMVRLGIILSLVCGTLGIRITSHWSLLFLPLSLAGNFVVLFPFGIGIVLVRLKVSCLAPNMRSLCWRVERLRLVLLIRIACTFLVFIRWVFLFLPESVVLRLKPGTFDGGGFHSSFLGYIYSWVISIEEAEYLIWHFSRCDIWDALSLDLGKILGLYGFTV